MNWEQGQIVKVDGQRYLVEYIAQPYGSRDGTYELTLQESGPHPNDVPVEIVRTAGDAVDWTIDMQPLRFILAAVIPEIAALHATKILEACREHDGDHGQNCGYAIAADVIANRDAP